VRHDIGPILLDMGYLAAAFALWCQGAPYGTAYERWQSLNHNDKPEIIFAGRSGESREDAIVIQNAANHRAVVNA
jgi:hypothetical protein